MSTCVSAGVGNLLCFSTFFFAIHCTSIGLHKVLEPFGTSFLDKYHIIDSCTSAVAFIYL